MLKFLMYIFMVSVVCTSVYSKIDKVLEPNLLNEEVVEESIANEYVKKPIKKFKYTKIFKEPSEEKKFSEIKLREVEISNDLFALNTQENIGKKAAEEYSYVQTNESVVELSLTEVLKAAMDSNLDVQISESRKRISNIDVNLAYGNYIPEIGFNSFYENRKIPIANLIDGGNNGSISSESWQLNSFFKGELPTGADYIFEFKNQKYRTDNVFQFLSPEYSSSFNFELKQPLLRNLFIDDTRRKIKVKKVDRTISNYEFQSQLAEVLKDTENTYWDLLSKRKEVEIKEQLVQLADKQIKRIKRFVDIGKAPEVEVISANAEKQKRLEELAVIQEKLFRKENDLRLLISSSQFSKYWGESLIPNEPFEQITDGYIPLEKAIIKAFDERPEIKKLFEEKKINKIDKVSIINDGLPQVDLSLQYSMIGLAGNAVNSGNALTTGQSANPRFIGDYGDNLGTALENDFRTARAGVTVSWPVAPYVVKKKVQKNRLERKILFDEINKLTQEIKSEVVNAYNSIKVAEQRIEAGIAGLKDAEIQLEAEEKKYSIGMSTTFLVLTRQTELADAKLRFTKAIVDFNKSIVEYEYAVGNAIKRANVIVADN